jgi:hypothetical protein
MREPEYTGTSFHKLRLMYDFIEHNLDKFKFSDFEEFIGYSSWVSSEVMIKNSGKLENIKNASELLGSYSITVYRGTKEAKEYEKSLSDCLIKRGIRRQILNHNA